MEKYLDECLRNFFIDLLNEKGFCLTRSESNSSACYKDFENETLKFRILNDRGVLETSLTAKNSKDFREMGSILKQLNLTPALSGFQKGNRQFNLEELGILFRENYPAITTFLTSHTPIE